MRPAVLSGERAVPVSGRPVIMWEEWERARRGDCGPGLLVYSSMSSIKILTNN